MSKIPTDDLKPPFQRHSICGAAPLLNWKGPWKTQPGRDFGEGLLLHRLKCWTTPADLAGYCSCDVDSRLSMVDMLATFSGSPPESSAVPS